MCLTDRRLKNSELEKTKKLKGMKFGSFFEMHKECWNSDISFLWKIAIVTRNGTYMVEQSSEARKWQPSSLEWIKDNN